MLEARRLAALYRYSELRRHDEWSSDLLAAEGKVTKARAARDLSLAYVLIERLPCTLEALRAGKIDRAKVDQIDVATTVLTDEKARELDERLYPRATQLNPRQLADFVRREVAEVDPEGYAKRAEMAREDRRVSIEPASDGMGWLNLFHTAEDLQAIKNRIDQLMRELPKDDRTADQRRADIVRDLILGGTSNVQAHIYVTVD